MSKSIVEDYTAYTLFTTGIKPAYIAEINEVDGLQQKYPSLKLDQNNHLFFQSDQYKKEFTNRLALVEPNSPEYHKLLGQTLGYPSQAVDFFAQCMENPELRKKRAGFHYAGMTFVGNVDQVLEICYWLWKNVRIPMTFVEVEHLRVKYRIFPEKI